MNNIIDWKVITETAFMGKSYVATKFKIKLNLGDAVFYSQKSFENEEVAIAGIDSLKDLLYILPKQLPEGTEND